MSTFVMDPGGADQPRYRPETNWPPLGALLTGIAIVVVSLAVALGFVAAYAAAQQNFDLFDDGAPIPMGVLLSSQLLMQALTVLLVLWVAGFFGSDRRAALSLNAMPHGVWDVAKGFLLLMIISGAFTVFAMNFARSDIRQDLETIWPLMRGEYWWLMALIAVIGAPLSEELMFRGFLQSALAKPLGFWVAGLVTNTCWAALHADYTLTGLVDVFIAGAVFTYLLWRTGSLWVPIACHGLYNGTIFLVLWLSGGPEVLLGPATL